jgi:molybdopterin adenylyltransferase
MTACAVAALTVYDMVKGIERGIAIEQVVLLEKHGGRSDYVRGQDAAAQPQAAQPAHATAAHEHREDPARVPFGAAVVTISTSKAAGRGEDESGARLARLVQRLGGEVIASELIADDRVLIEATLRRLASDERCALVLTSGGTGLSPSDVTPEATAAVIERNAPGIGEAMRAASRTHTPNWMLSRALAGVREGTLIVNFPGSPASVEQTGDELAGPLLHALALLSGRDGGHPHGA